MQFSFFHIQSSIANRRNGNALAVKAFLIVLPRSKHTYMCTCILTYTSVYMQWQPNKSAPKMAPTVEMQTWRFSVQSVEFIVTTMKTKINNGIPIVLYPLSPYRLFLCQWQWACVPCFITIDKLALQQTARKTTTHELGCALFNALQIFGKSFYIARV